MRNLSKIKSIIERNLQDEEVKKELGDQKQFAEWMKQFRLDKVEKEVMDEFFHLLGGAKAEFQMALLDLLRLFLRYDG